VVLCLKNLGQLLNKSGRYPIAQQETAEVSEFYLLAYQHDKGQQI